MGQVGYDGLTPDEFNKGLSEQEALAGLEKFGFNQVSERNNGRLRRFFIPTIVSLMLVLIAAAGATGIFIGDWADGSLILLAVGVSTTLGFFRNLTAEKPFSN